MKEFFKNQKIKCNHCGWKGLRKELEIVPRYDDDFDEPFIIEHYDACPSCATDVKLLNTKNQ